MPSTISSLDMLAVMVLTASVFRIPAGELFTNFLENAVVASVSTRLAKPLLVEPEVLSENDSSTTEDENSSADEGEVVFRGVKSLARIAQ